MPSIVSTFSDPLGRYYTRDRVSEVLVSFLSIKNPKIVLDLGSGDGSLSKAAAKKWEKAQYITVDIESNTSLDSELTLGYKFKHKHFFKDALEPSLIQDLGLAPEKIDLAICNPPFIRPQWQKKHHDFLINAGLPKEIIGVKELSAEVIFVVHNLASLKPGGQLGVIIPDGFISGEKNRKFREFILKSNSIEKVVKLPTNAFVGTNAQAHIVIITKGGVNKLISLEQLETLGDLSREITISKAEAIESLDYSYHHGRNRDSNQWLTLSDLGCTVNRGKSNSKQCRESREKIFHTIDIKDEMRSIDFEVFTADVEPMPAKHVIAKEGDILIARVGRNLTKKICMVSNGKAPISDCIYRLDVPIKWRSLVYEYLVSEEGKAALLSRLRGTGAKYLTMERLLTLPVTNILDGENCGR